MTIGQYEQQSTINPNMPVRDLFYISEELKKIVAPGSLYRTVKLKIPVPRFLVFYNGVREQPERQVYKLSDLFQREEGVPELELKVTVLNINKGYNKVLLEECESLRGYMEFVGKVRAKRDSGTETGAAVKEAVEECISENILPHFFREHKEEVVDMGIFEFDQELHDKILQEDARQEGEKKGIDMVNQLAAVLSEAGRMDDFLKSLSDERFQKRLFAEFGLGEEE